MAIQGTNLGSAFYEILPDLNVGQFVAAGAAAGAAIAQGINSSAAKGLSGANSALMKTLSAGFSGVGKALSSAITGSITSARGAVGTLNTLAGTIRAVGTAALGAAGAVGRGLWRGLNLASDAARSLGSHLGIMSFQVQMVGGMLTSLVTGPLAAASIGLAKWGLETAMVMEDATVALKAILPAGYDVEGLVSRLNKLAIESPVFAIDQLFDFTRKLVGAGIEAEKAEVILDSLNKVFITYGVTGEKASRALLGVSQVFSKGKVNAEELTQQIGEQIPIWHLMAEATGRTQAELREMVFQGEISAEMFGDILAQIGQLPTVSSGATEGVSTLSAQITILKESLQQMLAVEILKFFPDIKAELDRLRPTIQELFEFIVKQVPGVIRVLGLMVDKFLELKQRYDELSPAQKALAKQIAAITVVAGPALLVLGGLLTVLSTLIGIVSMAINPWAVLIAGLVAGFTHLYRTSEDFRLGIEAFRKTFLQAFMKELPAIAAALRRIAAVFVQAFGEIKDASGFTTWVAFGEYMGKTLPKLITRGLNAVAESLERTLRIALDLRDRWNALDETTKRHVKNVLAAASAYIVFLPQITAVAGVVAALAMNLRLLLNPWGVAVGAIAAGLIYLYRTSESFRTQVNLFVQNFKTGFMNEMPGAVAELVASLRKLLDVVLSLFPNMRTNVRELGQDLGTWLPHMMAEGTRLLAQGISMLADGIAFLRDVWRSLDDATQDHILNIMKWTGLAVALAPILAPLMGALGTILGLVKALINPFTAILVVLGAGFYLLYTRVEEFRYQVDTFVAAFRDGFRRKVMPALRNLWDALHPLADAVLRLLGYFGLKSWRDFGGWAGSGLTTILAGGINLVADAVRRVADGMQSVMDKWDALSPKQQDMILKFAGWAAAAAGVALAVGRIATALSGLTTGLGILMNPWLLAIAAIGGGLYYLYTNNETFRESVDAFGDSFTTTFKEKSPAALEGLQTAISERLIPAFENLARALGFETLQEFGAWLGEKFALGAVGAIDLFTKAIIALADGIQYLADKMPEIRQKFADFKQDIQELKDKWEGLEGWQKKALIGLGGAGALVATGHGGAIQGAASAAGGLLGTLAMLGPTGIAAAGGIGLITAAYIGAYRENDTFKEKVDGFVKGFKDGFKEKVLPALKEVWESLKDKLAPAFQDFLNAMGGGSPEEAGKQWAQMFETILHALKPLIVTLSIFLAVARLIPAAYHAIQSSLYMIAATAMDWWNRFADLWNKVMPFIKRMPTFDKQWVQNIRAEGTKSAILATGAVGVFSPEEVEGALSLMESNKTYFEPEFEEMVRNSMRTQFATGGMVRGPGTALSDSILARLSDGEFVVNAQATRQYRGLLEAVNAGHSPSSILAKLMSLDSAYGYSTRAQRSEEYDRLRMAILLDKAGAHWTPPAPTLNSIPSLHGINDIPASAGSGQDVYVTVYVGNELLVNQMQAVVDANNRAIINVARSVRTVA